MILKRFDSAAAASSALAGEVSSVLQSGLARRESGSIAVAGGRTPVPLFRALSAATLPWERVGITLTDERWVAEDNPGSNAGLVRRELLANAAASACFVPLFDGSPSASGATASVWQGLQQLARPFDAVILGMGEDGHFASLFPGNEGLPAALDADAVPGCVAMQAPVEPHERISLNLPALLQTRRLFLLISGARKRELVFAAAQGGQPSRWPVAALLARRQTATEVYWAP